MENNKKETPFVYNLGDRLKYICSKGEMITVIERYHQYDKKTGTVRNVYLLTIENHEGCGYTTQKYAPEKYMMSSMRRVYSPKDPKAFLKKEFNVPKDIITEAFDFTAKYMECREDDNVIKEFFNPEDFEKKSNDALSCGYYETLEEENEKWKRFYARLNEENKDLKEINKGLRRQLDIRDSMLDKKSISYKQWTDTMYENKMVNGENEALKMENEELRKINEDLACSYENVKSENEKLKNETQAMKDELKETKDALDRKGHEIDIWKTGWYECLKSLGYYLNS